MRMLAQDRAFYLRLRVDGTDDPEALRRLRQLEGIDRIRKEVGLAAFGVGRSTYYERRKRWQAPQRRSSRRRCDSSRKLRFRIDRGCDGQHPHPP